MQRLQIAIAASWAVLLTTRVLSAATTTLDFNAPVPGTLNDTNGLGTGFTHRLPGTGSALPGNDPNMDLLADPGRLTIRSASADTVSTSAYPIMETFGLRLPSVGTSDLSVSALVRNVDLTTSQLNLYVGSDSDNYVRAGFHPYFSTEQSVLVYGMVNAVQIDYFSQAAVGVLHGDDAVLTFSRTSGLWQLSWDNLTHPASSGVSPLLSIASPDINSYQDLYVGIYFNTPTNRTPSTELAYIDSFSVNIIPEPSAVVLATLGLVALTALGWRRRNRREPAHLSTLCARRGLQTATRPSRKRLGRLPL